METHVDLIFNDQYRGDVASTLLANGKIDAGVMKPFVAEDGNAYISVFRGGDPKDPNNYKAVQANAGTLRRDEWKSLDEAVLKIAEAPLGGVEDLRSRGLVYNLGNGLGTTVFEWHDVSDALTADVTMDGISRANNDRVTFQTNYLPLPIIHADYQINTRELAASRNLGNPLDTTMAERAARKVLLKLEQMLFTNDPYIWGTVDDRNRNTIYGYINHPDRNTVTLSTYGNWDESAGTSPREILESVKDMKQASIDDKHFGPWVLYIPSNYETVMDLDYEDTGNTATGLTIRERIKKIEGIQDVKVNYSLPADNVVLVQMTSDVVRLINGLSLQNVEWQTEGKFINKYKVMTIQVPQVRSDAEGKCGIVHMS